MFDKKIIPRFPSFKTNCSSKFHYPRYNSSENFPVESLVRVVFSRILKKITLSLMAPYGAHLHEYLSLSTVRCSKNVLLAVAIWQRQERTGEKEGTMGRGEVKKSRVDKFIIAED